MCYQTSTRLYMQCNSMIYTYFGFELGKCVGNCLIMRVIYYRKCETHSNGKFGLAEMIYIYNSFRRQIWVSGDDIYI